jgi:hypothetical protein
MGSRRKQVGWGVEAVVFLSGGLGVKHVCEFNCVTDSQHRHRFGAAPAPATPHLKIM